MRTPRSADDVFAALADPTRRWLLEVLGTHGPATATALAAQAPVTRQAVVKHLGVLDEAGLVTGRRSGREVRWAVDTGRLTDAARWLSDRAAEWDARLERLKQLAEADPSAPG